VTLPEPTLLDSRFEPKPENSKRSIVPMTSLRVYESSMPGLVTVYLRGDAYGPGRGIRLDRSQVETLAADLSAYLLATEEGQ
jgi:hypothetical protein